MLSIQNKYSIQGAVQWSAGDGGKGNWNGDYEGTLLSRNLSSENWGTGATNLHTKWKTERGKKKRKSFSMEMNTLEYHWMATI